MSDERKGQHRAVAWHRGQQLIALSESNIGGNHLGQALVEEGVSASSRVWRRSLSLAPTAILLIGARSPS